MFCTTMKISAWNRQFVVFSRKQPVKPLQLVKNCPGNTLSHFTDETFEQFRIVNKKLSANQPSSCTNRKHLLDLLISLINQTLEVIRVSFWSLQPRKVKNISWQMSTVSLGWWAIYTLANEESFSWYTPVLAGDHDTVEQGCSLSFWSMITFLTAVKNPKQFWLKNTSPWFFRCYFFHHVYRTNTSYHLCDTMSRIIHTHPPT